MPKNTSNVLTADEIKDIKGKLRKIHDLLPTLDKAEECGVNCTEHRADLRRLQEQLTKVLEHFG